VPVLSDGTDIYHQFYSVFATDSGSISLENGVHGHFTQSLLKFIDQPLDMDAMMMEVRRDLPLLVLDIRKERGHITA
jgi:hypothetical protein